MTENDLHYLRAIHRHLVDLKDALADTAAFSLTGMSLADNVDWLDCFIDKEQRALTATDREGAGGA